MRTGKAMALAAFVGLAVPAAGQGAARSYTLVELSPPSGSTVAHVSAINNMGVAVGSRATGTSTRPVIWNPTGAGTNLGLAPDVTSATALDINDEGTILYRALTGAAAGWYSRSLTGTYTMLEAPVGYEMVSARAINSYGEVVGALAAVGGQGPQIVAVWRPTPSGLVPELLTPTVDDFVEGRALNDAGIVTSSSGTTAFGPTLVVDRRTGGVVEIETGGQFTEPNGVNNAGNVVYVFDESSSDVRTAVTGIGEVFGFGCENGGRCLTDTQIDGFAINESGHVVGRSNTVFVDEEGFPIDTDDTNGAFVWSQETGILRLIDLVVEGDTSGWEFDLASDINDAGWIVGNGTKNGQPRPFLLIPRDPCAGDTNRDGLVTPADFGAWISAFNAGCD